MVTVMSYKNGIMTGCLQHPRLDGKKEFHSLSQMVLLLDGLMDLESCPNPPPPFIFPEYDGGEKEEIFPWDFIDIGVTKEFLQREWKRALEEIVTPNCRAECSGCGARAFGGGVCYENQD